MDIELFKEETVQKWMVSSFFANRRGDVRFCDREKFIPGIFVQAVCDNWQYPR
jgi:hypothetical protein